MRAEWLNLNELNINKHIAKPKLSASNPALRLYLTVVPHAKKEPSKIDTI